MSTFRPRIPIREEDKKVIEINQPKLLAIGGVWQVPPAERPAQWEKMSLKEPTPSVQNKNGGLC